VSGYIKT